MKPGTEITAEPLKAVARLSLADAPRLVDNENDPAAYAETWAHRRNWDIWGTRGGEMNDSPVGTGTPPIA